MRENQSQERTQGVETETRRDWDKRQEREGDTRERERSTALSISQ